MLKKLVNCQEYIAANRHEDKDDAKTVTFKFPYQRMSCSIMAPLPTSPSKGEFKTTR